MRGLIKSLLVSLWFMFLTFPIVAIRVDIARESVDWRPMNVVYIGLGSFVLSFVWRALLVKKGDLTPEEAEMTGIFEFFAVPCNRNFALAAVSLLIGLAPLAVNLFLAQAPGVISFVVLTLGVLAAWINFAGRREALIHKSQDLCRLAAAEGPARRRSLAGLLGLLIILPFVSDTYQTTVLASALIWVVMGLGLNIVVGQAGLLVLGYVAFYAVGAYTYALINQNYGLGFWTLLPVCGLFAALAGLIVGFPVLRLRGDYLAIVTLGFGEIVRLVLQNWSDFSNGPKGVDNIPRPGFFGVQMNMEQGMTYVYYIALALVIVTVFAVARLRDSRLGRAWMALREDEIACEAMGIDKTWAKLTAFSLGACWAGFGGALFAAKTVFINPASFTFMESATILSIVVLGGLGSILGVVVGALILVLLPEYLRAFSEYRMLIFGASMVLMMVFRPQGLVKPERKIRRINEVDAEATAADKAVS